MKVDLTPAELREFVGYEGLYAVSERGDVWSVRAKKFLKHDIDYKGYRKVTLCDSLGHPKKWSVASLVLIAFVGPRPNGLHAAHIDGDKDNNHVSNLKWCSARENNLDKLKHGTMQIGSSNHQSKLTERDVQEIIDRHLSRESLSALAREFGVNFSTLRRIAVGASWKHVNRPILKHHRGGGRIGGWAPAVRQEVP